MYKMKIKNTFLGLLLVVMIAISGCSNVDVTSVIQQAPQVKAYLENNPNFDLQVVYYSESESSQIQGEFKANCGKELTQKGIYRFVIDDKKSLSGVGYFDLDNNILECFKKVNNGQVSVEGETVDTSSTSNEAIVVDDVIINKDGSVLVGNNVNVESNGDVSVANIDIKKEKVVKVNKEIKVSSVGDVTVGGISVNNDGVNMGDISVNDNGVKIGEISVSDSTGVVIGNEISVNGDDVNMESISVEGDDVDMDVNTSMN